MPAEVPVAIELEVLWELPPAAPLSRREDARQSHGPGRTRAVHRINFLRQLARAVKRVRCRARADVEISGERSNEILGGRNAEGAVNANDDHSPSPLRDPEVGRLYEVLLNLVPLLQSINEPDESPLAPYAWNILQDHYPRPEVRHKPLH